jgi:hypothetical protein
MFIHILILATLKMSISRDAYETCLMIRLCWVARPSTLSHLSIISNSKRVTDTYVLICWDTQCIMTLSGVSVLSHEIQTMSERTRAWSAPLCDNQLMTQWYTHRVIRQWGNQSNISVSWDGPLVSDNPVHEWCHWYNLTIGFTHEYVSMIPLVYGSIVSDDTMFQTMYHSWSLIRLSPEPSLGDTIGMFTCCITMKCLTLSAQY